MIHTVYSYEGCKQVLEHPAALIPPVNMAGLNEHALSIANALARLSNPPEHACKRAHTQQGFQDIRPAQILNISPGQMDFVATIGRRLPATIILGDAATDTIIDALPDLVLIMRPEKTAAEIAAINTAAVHFNGHIAGLLIQSYDAGNGLLSNALIHSIKKGRPIPASEILKIDPPILNTRRIAGEAMQIEGQAISKGDLIIVQIGPHFPFGIGIHQCMAEKFCIDMTDATIKYLFNNFNIRLLTEEITYLPQLNARIPQSIQIELS